MTVSSETRRAISTPDQLASPLGTLEFVDGVPSSETVERVYDHLDFVHALNVFLNGYAGASTVALRKGFHEAGAADNQILIFSELMGSESLFLTANADTVYYVGIVDLTSGPMVVETPPQALALFDDMWFQWIVDFGLPGPDRGEGGRFLLVPPGYDGPLPDSGYHVRHSRTTRVVLLGRSFLVRRRPGADGRADQAHAEALPLRPGWLRHEHRDAAGGPGAARPAGSDSRDGVRRGQREGVQHDPAERPRLLRAAERAGAGAAGGQHGRRADGAAGRDRDRQGQAVRARRADAAHPRGRGGRRRRDLARAGLRSARVGRVRLLRRARRGYTHCGSADTTSRPRRRWSPRRGSSRSPRPAFAR